MELRYLVRILTSGTVIFSQSAELALICFCLYVCARMLINAYKGNFKFNPINEGKVLVWTTSAALILFATGIIGGSYGVSNPFNGTSHISFSLIDEGITWALIFNILLFIPFGFMTTLVFPKKMKSMWSAFVIGLLFSLMIEFTQTFTGRFAQVEDLIMNSMGTVIGFMICKKIVKASIDVRIAIRRKNRQKNAAATGVAAA